MPESLGLRLLVLGALIVCSAILTGAEAAYFSLGRARLRHVAPKGETQGEPKPLIERPHELLVTLLVGITVINIGAAALAAAIADDLFGPNWGRIVQIVVLIFVLTTFGEVLPMTLAVKYPEGFLAFAGRPVAWLGVLLAPVRAALAALSTLTVRLIGRQAAEQAMLSEEELRTLRNLGVLYGQPSGAGCGIIQNNVISSSNVGRTALSGSIIIKGQYCVQLFDPINSVGAPLAVAQNYTVQVSHP